jgi:pimeloyl-ACP methyl ester carboxylesterase
MIKSRRLEELEMNSPFFLGRTASLREMEMYYEIRGEGDPLLLLHGFTGSGADWQLIFKDPPKGFQLITPDLRGHGRSTNHSKDFRFRKCAFDVFELLDRLEIGKFKAIGMSGGAITLLHMATQQPARVEAIVLVSAAHYFPDQARAIMRRQTEEGRSEIEWQIMRQHHKHGDGQILELWRQGNAMKDSYDDVNFTPPYLSTIKASVLIVHGDRDSLYPVAIPVAMHTSIPQSFLWIVPNGGHVPIFGHLAARFVQTALPFLRGEWERRREN